MENATHEEQAQCNNPKFLGKAGWVKKAPCKLLASYKDSYIHVDKTAIAVYENEDLKNCIERLDLQNYDKCHELKSIFMRKHRLILIRLPKSGIKIHNIKFQVQTAEEKEAWIQALSDGINRAKNKVLDEIKMDESSNLQHLTRTRPKGNRNRRPPTRIHMKEVAELSSEGMLRLDLGLLDAAVANGTYHANADDIDVPLETNKSPVLECKSTEGAENPHAETQAEFKVMKLHKERQEKAAWKNPSPPPFPNLPSGSPSELAGTSQSKCHNHPPTPPTKDKKPSYVPSKPNQGAELPPDSNEDKQQEHKNDKAKIPHYETLPCVGDMTTCTGYISEDDKANIDQQRPRSDISIPTERKSLIPPLIPKKKHYASSILNIQPTEKDTTGSQQGEDHLKRSVPVTSLPDDVLLSDPTNYNQMFLPIPKEKTTNADDDCVDLHLNARSEASEHENTFKMSTTAVSTSDSCTDVNLMLTTVTDKIEDESKVSICQHSEAIPPPTKVRSVSFGDLLSDSSHITSLSCHSAFIRNEVDLITLEKELTLEMDETNTLMSSVCQAGMPRDLLTKAMEKFKKADHVLKEIKELKHTKSLRKRNSW
ncbi:uncharacterized protein plekho2 [Festucalex cinctus]